MSFKQKMDQSRNEYVAQAKAAADTAQAKMSANRDALKTYLDEEKPEEIGYDVKVANGRTSLSNRKNNRTIHIDPSATGYDVFETEQQTGQMAPVIISGSKKNLRKLDNVGDYIMDRAPT